MSDKTETPDAAKADTSAAAKPAKTARKAKTPRKAKAVAPDIEKLRVLAAEIEAHKGGALDNLIHRLQVEEGMKLKDDYRGAQIRMAGISTTCTAGVAGALDNWANAARRAVLKGGA